jgi:RTX calcium-binding nonapeptide repeat (4 copies)
MEIAFQADTGDLWTWTIGDPGSDTGLGMMAGTSPSISQDPGVGASRPPTKGGTGNDRLNGSSRSDLIFGGRGNDRIFGGRGNDRLYGGPGNDRIYGGPGNDHIHAGAGNDQIVDHRGATTVFPGTGTNWVDVADRRGDDRVVCAPGSTNHIVADRGDRMTRSCGGKGVDHPLYTRPAASERALRRYRPMLALAAASDERRRSLKQEPGETEARARLVGEGATPRAADYRPAPQPHRHRSQRPPGSPRTCTSRSL